jgi:hypothetical protein
MEDQRNPNILFKYNPASKRDPIKPQERCKGKERCPFN